jgi:ABC-type multidrug transport system fused ATPase/permease subunit
MVSMWELPLIRRKVSRVADRIYRYLNRIPEVGQAVGAKFLQPLSKSIQFESVSYSLPNKRKVLDGLDLKIPAGEVTSVLSLDPLSAQALAYLLPRFIEPQAGRVLFDGEDIAWVTLESLRAETMFVGQSDPFFTGTVLENITCGSGDYSLQEITEASKQTHAHNFILKLPQGYETVLGEHGEQLDAGQAFRLGLARAVLRDPALMIIAEPSETMDEDTKSLLDDAYNRITRNRTVIFLPSRLSTLRRADHIVLLHQGKVEAVGTYATLVRKSALYRHWEYMRFSEFSRQQELVT